MASFWYFIFSDPNCWCCPRFCEKFYIWLVQSLVLLLKSQWDPHFDGEIMVRWFLLNHLFHYLQSSQIILDHLKSIFVVSLLNPPQKKDACRSPLPRCPTRGGAGAPELAVRRPKRWQTYDQWRPVEKMVVVPVDTSGYQWIPVRTIQNHVFLSSINHESSLIARSINQEWPVAIVKRGYWTSSPNVYSENHRPKYGGFRSPLWWPRTVPWIYQRALFPY